MIVENLKLIIDNETIFNNISFELKKGKITLLTGKSGVGKSALLMSMCGVIPNTVEGILKGTITLNNRSIIGLSTEEISGELAYVSQDADSQLCSFTVEDELAFSLENFGYDAEDIDKIIDETLELLDIVHLRYRELNGLSGGEKQKVVLASILVFNPEIILADEPTANLDPKATKQILSELKLLCKKFGKTILLVEHKIEDVEEIVDNILVMKKDCMMMVDKDEFYKCDKSRAAIPRLNSRKIEKEAILEIDKLSFSYPGQVEGLDDICFSVNKGEILGITGYNGAGKSTLLKLLMGLLKSKNGDINYRGREISTMSPKDIGKKIGMVFQNPEHQFIKMNTEDEIKLSLIINKEQEKIIMEKSQHYLKLFDLEHVKDKNPFLLSQGQKRRLSTASMMINGQEILLLDEPTYGQDRENLKKLMMLLYEVNKLGTSIVIVTHDKEIIKKSCDRVLYLENNKIKYLGKADDFHEYDEF